MRPMRIYLDVDGVLNAVNNRPPSWGWGAERRVEVNGWPITYSPELIDALNKVTARPGVEVYWLTTWCHDAPTKLAPAIGLHGADWPVVGYDHWRSNDHKAWWKLRAIQEHLDGFEGGVLWVDDDLRYDAAAVAWLNGQPNIVGLSPRTELGITRAQSNIVRDCADRLTLNEPLGPQGGAS